MQQVATSIFERMESNVRSYCRAFPDKFERAKGEIMYTKSGREFIDFFAGAGALNYGHNNDYIKRQILAYIETDGIAHGLDLYTTAKEEFLQTFEELILNPNQYEYKLQFCGPTGSNAVEAALKIARKTTKRTGIFAFTGGFHGMSLGSLSVTANKYHRDAAGTELNQVTFMPHPSQFAFDTIDYMDTVLTDTHSGVAKPAAIIFETVQAEGGVNVTSIEWMQQLRALCDKHEILLICDDIQVGCGRTGPFFSFERANIVPDIVVLSKSISGYGLPMSLLLLKPELDQWQPAEHNGTFRGNQLAFIGATAALKYRELFEVGSEVSRKEQWIEKFLYESITSLHDRIAVRGIGLIWGIDLSRVCEDGAALAKQVATRCYEYGLILERVGRDDTVLKLMPPLTISHDRLEQGCTVLQQAIMECLQER